MVFFKVADSLTRKLVEVLKILGFHGGYADPFLMTRRNKLGIVFIGLYVYDCLCICNDAAIKDLVKGMEREGFTLKIDEELTDYFKVVSFFFWSTNKDCGSDNPI
jgi:hypothetical protein